jgi:hypothetical protein
MIFPLHQQPMSTSVRRHCRSFVVARASSGEEFCELWGAFNVNFAGRCNEIVVFSVFAIY